MPQQVCPSGNSTVTPRRRSSFTTATPTSGKKTSPRQVIMSETFTNRRSSCLRPVWRRRRDDDENQEGLRPVVDQAMLDAGRGDERLPGRQPLLRAAQREPPDALQDVIDLVLVVVRVSLL